MTARIKTKHGQRERLRITSSLDESIFTMWLMVSLKRIRISWWQIKILVIFGVLLPLVGIIKIEL